MHISTILASSVVLLTLFFCQVDSRASPLIESLFKPRDDSAPQRVRRADFLLEEDPKYVREAEKEGGGLFDEDGLLYFPKQIASIIFKSVAAVVTLNFIGLLYQLFQILKLVWNCVTKTFKAKLGKSVRNALS